MSLEKYIAEDLQAQIFTFLKNQPQFSKCVDCNSLSPTWASIEFGILICYHCSGNIL